MTNEYSEWLSNLKEGDEVAIYTVSIWNCPYEIKTVTRITPTLIRVSRHTFRRSNGVTTGNSRVSLSIPTKEVKETIEKYALVTQIEKVEWSKLSLPKLRAVTKALEDE